ncbi:MAG TPA: DUF4870 domain-containing protein [Ignavibacteria bacterium]|nr:hypothetical protein [Bacteroidota bacterium]HRI84593.1 DUF4870 domain-containing protein [Ignavibacteria bacterium]HRK00186.1 DUF4870 domain-containing protein [Ignavibacteria bacterium]
MKNQDTANETSATSEERTLSLLCHLSMLLGGILLPIIIWATQKSKSQFVRFHSLQAIFFQIMLGVIIVFGVIIFLILMLASGFGLGELNNQGNSDMPVFIMIFMFSFYGFIFLFVFAAIGYSIYIGLKAYKGELVRVIFIGNIIYKKVYG